MALQEFFSKLGSLFYELSDGIGMREAKLDRLARETGIEISVPTTRVCEVTDEARIEIISTRAQLSDADWLRPDAWRDQICVRHGLTPDQVAGVLARHTYCQNGNGKIDEVETSDHVVDAQVDLTPVPSQPSVVSTSSSAITDDPSTWPQRTPRSGYGVPTRKEYEINDLDREIVEAVIVAGRWDDLRVEISKIRRLARQQVAGIKAVRNRNITAA